MERLEVSHEELRRDPLKGQSITCLLSFEFLVSLSQLCGERWRRNHRLAWGTHELFVVGLEEDLRVHQALLPPAAVRKPSPDGASGQPLVLVLESWPPSLISLVVGDVG